MIYKDLKNKFVLRICNSSDVENACESKDKTVYMQLNKTHKYKFGKIWRMQTARFKGLDKNGNRIMEKLSFFEHVLFFLLLKRLIK